MKKEVNSYVPASACYIFDSITKILAEYGVKYVLQPFLGTDFKGDRPILVALENGIITTDRAHFINNYTQRDNILPWDQWEPDFSVLPKARCIIGTHFPNYLHMDPKRNSELTLSIAEYVKSCANRFGSMMSRDLGFYSTQALYKRFSQTEEKNGSFTVDVSRVPKVRGNLGKFYVSSESPIKHCDGGEIALYETKETYFTYEISPNSDVITLS